MLGGTSIRTGLCACLLAAALFGCSIPLPLTRSEPPPATTRAEPTVITLPPIEDTAVVSAPPPIVARDGLWQQIAAGLQLESSTPRSDQLHDLIPHANKIIAAATARSAPFLYYIVSELDRLELPYEIALIPILESGYDAAAEAPGGAAGLWQLIPATAQRFGLALSRGYDGRRDVIASTDAALTYLAALHDRFDGDWLLAFAAYNCGERTVENAIARNRERGRPTHYTALELPASTKGYVTKLLALAAIVREQQPHAGRLAMVPDHPYFEAVDVGSHGNLAFVAAHSGLDEDEFAVLNAAFRQGVLVANAPHRVLVRFGHGTDVASALARAPATAPAFEPRAGHVVRSGESLSLIAARAGVSVAALKAANGLSSNRLRIGQVLRIPGDADAGTPPTARPGGAVHVVAAGDTLSGIARRYGLSTRALARANQLELRSVLRPGQQLQLPRAAQASIHYEVRAGDSLWTIARRFKVSVADLRKWNALSGRRLLQPGQRLVVYRATDDDARREI